MSSTLLQTTGEYETPTKPRVGSWEDRHPIASLVMLLVVLALIGWLTFVSAEAENERRATYPAMDVR